MAAAAAAADDDDDDGGVQGVVHPRDNSEGHVTHARDPSDLPGQTDGRRVSLRRCTFRLIDTWLMDPVFFFRAGSHSLTLRLSTLEHPVELSPRSPFLLCHDSSLFAEGVAEP